MRRNFFGLKAVSVHGGTCGHVVVKAILDAYDRGIPDVVLVQAMQADEKKNVSSTQILRVLESRGLMPQEFSVEGWSGIEKELAKGKLAFCAMQNSGGVPHWVVLIFAGDVVEYTSWTESRAVKAKEFIPRLLSPVWVVTKGGKRCQRFWTCLKDLVETSAMSSPK